MIVVNASRISVDSKWIDEHIPGNVIFKNISDKTGKLDVQGPKSTEIMVKLL